MKAGLLVTPAPKIPDNALNKATLEKRINTSNKKRKPRQYLVCSGVRSAVVRSAKENKKPPEEGLIMWIFKVAYGFRNIDLNLVFISIDTSNWNIIPIFFKWRILTFS